MVCSKDTTNSRVVYHYGETGMKYNFSHDFSQLIIYFEYIMSTGEQIIVIVT